jgi:hypothetical protein
VRRVEVDDQYLGALTLTAGPAQLLQGRQETVQANRSPHPRQVLLGVEPCQLVVAPSGADAPKLRQLIQKGLEDHSGIVIQAPGDGGIQLEMLEFAQFFQILSDLSQALRALGFVPTQVLHVLQGLGETAFHDQELKDGIDGSIRGHFC